MNGNNDSKARSRLASGYQIAHGLVVAVPGRAAARPRAEGPPPGDPKKEPAAAAEVMKCPSCEAEVPRTEPPAKFCPACGKDLPAEPAANEAPQEPAPAEASAFAMHALAFTGAKSLEGARGVMAAWRGSAQALAGAQERLGVLERERALERAVGEGRLEPAEAWTFTPGPPDASGKPTKIRSFSAWAGPPAGGTGQSLEQLTAYIAQRGAAASAHATFTPAKAERSAPAAAPPPGIASTHYAAAAAQIAEQLGEK